MRIWILSTTRVATSSTPSSTAALAPRGIVSRIQRPSKIRLGGIIVIGSTSLQSESHSFLDINPKPASNCSSAPARPPLESSAATTVSTNLLQHLAGSNLKPDTSNSELSLWSGDGANELLQYTNCTKLRHHPALPPLASDGIDRVICRASSRTRAKSDGLASIVLESITRLPLRRKRSTKHTASSTCTLLRNGGQSDYFHTTNAVRKTSAKNVDSKKGYNPAMNMPFSRSSLPTKKRPIAKWRFVLEHLRRTADNPASSDHPGFPSMKPE
ncbi:unnamed protein product [Phytophthora lilii]|uniref:Unnamed protein product n=1 Tax=Phytophthora lilii TaxID=2077276 RepID=A0A9W6TAF7_9STRA|nr:unnamed protein product [Phytophthora lilii]